MDWNIFQSEIQLINEDNIDDITYLFDRTLAVKKVDYSIPLLVELPYSIFKCYPIVDTI
jgi:hypothetical protein